MYRKYCCFGILLLVGAVLAASPAQADLLWSGVTVDPLLGTYSPGTNQAGNDAQLPTGWVLSPTDTTTYTAPTGSLLPSSYTGQVFGYWQRADWSSYFPTVSASSPPCAGTDYYMLYGSAALDGRSYGSYTSTQATTIIIPTDLNVGGAGSSYTMSFATLDRSGNQGFSYNGRTAQIDLVYYDGSSWMSLTGAPATVTGSGANTWFAASGNWTLASSPGSYQLGMLISFVGAAVHQQFYINNLQLSGTVVPEPSTLAMLAAGLIGLLCYAWRKRK